MVETVEMVDIVEIARGQTAYDTLPPYDTLPHLVDKIMSFQSMLFSILLIEKKSSGGW